MSSHFDNSFYPFRCENCGTSFKKILRILVESDEVGCPRCRTIIDVRESKRTGDISRALDSAGEQDQRSIAMN